MLKYTILVVLVALSLQAEASSLIRRRDIGDNEVDFLPEFKVRAPWHGEADKGYPDFDGNPYKQSLVEMSSMLAYFAADALEGENDVPPVLKSIIEGAQKTNWKNFDEYLDYWGAAQVAVMEALEEEQQKLLPESVEIKGAKSISKDDSDFVDVDDE